jgi:hypothetical protein
MFVFRNFRLFNTVMEYRQKRKRNVKKDNIILKFPGFLSLVSWVYTLSMTIFATATPSTIPKTKNVKQVATFYAGVLVVMSVAQLFTFESFLKLMTSFEFPGGIKYAYFLTALLVVAEVFALPFLLRMALSPAFRFLSMLCGWLVALIWAKLTIWMVLVNTPINNVGFFGTVINVTPGWWAAFISIAFGLMAAWASWGMWPKFTYRKTSRK